MAQGDPREEKTQGKPQPQLKVTDRRLFTADGERRGDLPEEPEEPSPAPKPAPQQEKAEAPGFQHRPLEEPDGVDFTMLINAMAQPALLFLGEIPHPATGKANVDLEQARIQIDMLDLLRVKCRGNLSLQEEDLLERVLYELRMRYVARSGQSG